MSPIRGNEYDVSSESGPDDKSSRMYVRMYACKHECICICIHISDVFSPRAGLSLQAKEPRLHFCRRQVFHRKLGNQGCSFTRDGICAVASRCFPHTTLSLVSEHTLNRTAKIRTAPTCRWGERIWLSGPSGLHRNSPQCLNISSIRVSDRSEIRKSQSPFALIYLFIEVQQSKHIEQVIFCFYSFSFYYFITLFGICFISSSSGASTLGLLIEVAREANVLFCIFQNSCRHNWISVSCETLQKEFSLNLSDIIHRVSLSELL